LVGGEVETLEQMKEAGRALYDLGPRGVLVKGGHLPGDTAIDLYFDGERFEELTAPRYDTEDTHGTGCALSAAIAARLAHGDRTIEAVRFAKRFISGAIRHSLRLGRGYGPVNPAWDLPV
jgi:hydroxymethylpyrimidine/phosphomethylpyrimidine kinase